LPVAGDWDSNGVDSPGVYNQSAGKFNLSNLVCNCSTSGAYEFFFGTASDVPIAGDWNADGIDTVGAFRPSTGYMYWRNTLNTGFADGTMYYGIANDRPITGRWVNP
jgi:hypothetical protein